ncbi:MAG: hypothetical protein IIC67_10550 [Thaumarchaeota archaeon]|nr:hypothetical protein [Nitrososphaerota archaeon]
MNSSVKISYFEGKNMTVRLQLLVLTSILIIFVIPPVFAEIKQVPHNAYVNELYGFSIVPPTEWNVDENFQFENGDITLV